VDTANSFLMRGFRAAGFVRSRSCMKKDIAQIRKLI